MNKKFPSGTLDKLWADPHNWRGSVIYVCEDDPRVIVPKNPKRGGWTLNFAHASVWFVLLTCLLSIALPPVLLFYARLIAIAIGYELCIIVFWCGASVVLSSPKRYESGG
jgi:hypothetical protein